MESLRGTKTESAFRNQKSRELKRIRTAIIAGGRNPFLVPPPEEHADLFSRMQPESLVLPVGLPKPDLDNFNFALLASEPTSESAVGAQPEWEEDVGGARAAE